MKKIFLVVVLVLASVSIINAKDNTLKNGWDQFTHEVKASTPRAIGGNFGPTTEGISYQQSLNREKNMLDITAYFSLPLLLIPESNWGLGTSITYDWINPGNTQIPWDYKGEWNWAAGVGLAGGIIFSDPVSGHLGVAGHIGVAYDFWFPLELSIDYRPEIGPAFTKDEARFYTDGVMNITLGVRYLF